MAALYSAVKETFPRAIRLQCLKHIRDELQFDKISTQKILNLTIFDGKRELGLWDANGWYDFFAKLIEAWKEVE